MRLQTHQLQENPKDELAKKAIGFSLYALSKFKNTGQFDKVHYNHKDIEGEWQQAFHLFGEISDVELNTLALKYNWELCKELEFKDKLYARICDTLFHDLNKYHDLTTADFFDSNKKESTSTVKKQPSIGDMLL